MDSLFLKAKQIHSEFARSRQKRAPNFMKTFHVVLYVDAENEQVLKEDLNAVNLDSGAIITDLHVEEVEGYEQPYNYGSSTNPTPGS